MNTAPRVALITGGARRVGRAVVLRLAEAGFDVAFTYLTSQAQADSLVEQLKTRGRKGIAIQSDLTQPEASVNFIFQEFAETFGQLDLLVNNASIYEPSGLRTTNVEQIGRLTAIHLTSPLLLCRKFEQLLRADGGGHVVNMVDLLAERPWPEYLAYSASKAALWNLTLGLAKELAPQVTVNGIAPGVVEWPDDYPQAEREKYLKRVPLQRAGTPRDVAETIHFLCTTGTYITGQIIRLDGGRSVT